ncbi:hypothetical protein ACNKHU_12275 [Shigella flexneri]
MAQRQAGIFDGVVIVDIKVTLTLISIRETAVGGNLIRACNQEATPVLILLPPSQSSQHLNVNLRLFGVAHYMGVTSLA